MTYAMLQYFRTEGSEGRNVSRCGMLRSTKTRPRFPRMRNMAMVPVDKMETYRNLKICLQYLFMHQVQS